MTVAGERSPIRAPISRTVGRSPLCTKKRRASKICRCFAVGAMAVTVFRYLFTAFPGGRFRGPPGRFASKPSGDLKFSGRRPGRFSTSSGRPPKPPSSPCEFDVRVILAGGANNCSLHVPCYSEHLFAPQEKFLKILIQSNPVTYGCTRQRAGTRGRTARWEANKRAPRASLSEGGSGSR